MDLQTLIAGLPVQVSQGPEGRLDTSSIRVCDITEDSRTAMPGSLFVARRGTKVDGRGFVSTAIKAGAVAILTDDPRLHVDRAAVKLVSEDVPLCQALLAERFYQMPSKQLALCGVTGTNGKTTVTYLIHQLLSLIGLRCGLIGTVCIDDGVEVAPAILTTPPAMEISRTLGRMVDAGCVACEMETSSHALHQHRVGALRFALGIFTNLSHDHLDYHGTMENYAASKARLFEMLAPESVAIVNSDDPWHTRMLENCHARVLRCSLSTTDSALKLEQQASDTLMLARIVSRSISTTTVELCGIISPTSKTITMSIVGDHNVMNVMQALLAAWVVVHQKQTETGPTAANALLSVLNRLVAPPGRLQAVTTPDASIAVYVDYAHSDDSLARVCQLLRNVAHGKHNRGRLIVVFGCGGDRDAGKRPKMGAIAAELGDVVYVTNDNPRTEEPRAIAQQVIVGISASSRPKVVVELDRQRAIESAIAIAKPGDIVLIAGKGHENYQILPDPLSPTGTKRTDFDDRLVAAAALNGRGQATHQSLIGLLNGAAPHTNVVGKRPAIPARKKNVSTDSHADPESGKDPA